MKINIEEDFINDEIFEQEKNYDQTIADNFAEDMLYFLNYIISQSDDLHEQFVSNSDIYRHFKKHCIGKDSNKESGKGRILYDFTDKAQYVQYEKDITLKILRTPYLISSLYDYDDILKYMKKLFEGNIVVQFCNSCGLNKDGIISLSLIAYSSAVTTNYNNPSKNRIKGNTIDVCIKNATGKTISLYAVDAHDVQKRLNNTLSNYSTYRGDKFNFNND